MSRLETIHEDLYEDQENSPPKEKVDPKKSPTDGAKGETEETDNLVSPKEQEIVSSLNNVATAEVVNNKPTEVLKIIGTEEPKNDKPYNTLKDFKPPEGKENVEPLEAVGSTDSSPVHTSTYPNVSQPAKAESNVTGTYFSLLSKTAMVNPTPEQYEQLRNILIERLNECHGETLFDIGKEQDGIDEDGLKKEDYNASEATLISLASSLNSDCVLLTKRFSEKGICGKYLIRKIMDRHDFLEIRIAVVGNVDAGKSTLLGVLTHGELDNGRGYARQKLFRHKHEQETGRTSSVGNDILGFDNEGNVVNKPEHGSLDWVKICERSSKVITFIDLAGHERYLKTTVFGMTGHAPDFGMLMIGANAGVVGMTKEHLGLALALCVPVFAVVTKIDMCPTNVLDNTIRLLTRVLKSQGCRKVPVMIRTSDDVINTAANFISERLCPIFLVSNVNGKNLDLLKMFLNLLTSRSPSLENEPAEFQIDDTYSVPGVGTVVSGTTLKGVVRLNDTLLLGPDPLGHFQPIAVRSIHRKRMAVPEVRGGQTASFALKKVKRSQIRKGMVMVSPSLNPQACWEFEGEILVLHHPTTISLRYQAMVHCGSIRQTAFIVYMSQDCLRTGDKALVYFRFIKHPEYIRTGQRMVFREGRTKAVGTVTKVTPIMSTLLPIRGKTGKQTGKQGGKQSGKNKQGTSSSSATSSPQISAKETEKESKGATGEKKDSGKRNRGRRGGRGRQSGAKPLAEQNINVVPNSKGGVNFGNGNFGMFVCKEGPANALALNKDFSQVVVAGRNVFKIFSIETDEFVEIFNLRVGKNLNLNYSCNDVAWNLFDQGILATAATNGAVVLWNLNRSTRSKLEHIFNEHKRTVNKVRFHAIDPSLLLSGSQDGTMKCFDLRSREVAQTFYSNSESVRDVQFSPHQPHVFASVSENGTVQLWDLRKPDKHLLQFTAHSGPIFSCDWHPESEWLATASRDKTIKVWDLTQKTPAMEYLIHTIASIGHIKWRPERKFQLASSSLVVDCNINIWDVRRPYIPFASFDQHNDIPTGIAWKGSPHVFLSTGRDCMLFQHVMADALRPASDANPQAVSFNPLGDVAFARALSPGPPTSSKFPATSKTESSSIRHRFYQTSSELMVFKNNDLEFTNNFTKTATRYLLGGKPFAELCDHNAAVALEMENFNASVFWEMLKVFYSFPSDEARAVDYTELTSNLRRNESNLPNATQPRNPAKMQKSACDCDEVFGITRDVAQEEEVETEDETPNWMNPYSLRSLTENQQELQMQGDFFFGDDEFDPLSTMDPLASHTPLEIDWTLPREAFNIRHELEECSPIPEEFTGFGLLDELEAPVPNEEDIPPAEVTVKNPPTVQPLEVNTPVLKALRHHVDLGDLQTAVTALYVLGDRRRELGLDMHTQENWVSSYAELLARYRLFGVKTELIKRAWIPSINQLNQQSTNINVSCGECGKPLQKGLVRCDRCSNKECSKCSICHLPVRGLFIWCQGCAHGGHFSHMKEWFEDNQTCPEGCGHMCPKF